MSCAIDIVIDGDGVTNGREPDVHLGDGTVITLATLRGGMTSGRTSVAVIFELPDGKLVLAETSLRALLTAADALRIAHPDG